MKVSLFATRFQSTHPRGVRPVFHGVERGLHVVSIHAPARGATRETNTIQFPFYLFQSTHPRGVRHHCPRPAAWDAGRFNPRTREGCDARHHGPVRAGRHGFNPRTREGCDPYSALMVGSTAAFQSTHPRGVRLPSGHRQCPGRARVSIHAPARGATHRRRSRCPRWWRFNPRTREGCDQRHAAHLILRHRVSIHAPARGATPRTACRRRPACACFNPRTREGCDGQGDTGTAARREVSIHAPARGATRQSPVKAGR